MTSLHFDSRAVHLPVPPLDGARPMAPPLYQTSGFAFDDPAMVVDGLSRPDGPFVYGRLSNPTVRTLEEAVAGLEGGVAAVAASSGMGAISAVLLGLLKPGDHLIAQPAVYGGTASLIADLVARFQIAVTYVAQDDPEAARAAIRPETRLMYLETIANPMTQVADIPGMCAVANSASTILPRSTVSGQEP
jgi:methionine-gamma-lyase